MKTVWKFGLPMGDVVAVDLHVGAEVLTVQTQHEALWLWALVDPKAPKETRWFRITGTGHDIDAESVGDYIGTAQTNNGRLVWHVFAEPVG